VLGECPLRRDCAGSCVSRTREREEKRVTLRVDLLPARRAERLAQDAALAAEHLGVPVGELLQEGGRALDVGEQEGDRAAWKRAQGAEYEGDPPRGGNEPLPPAARRQPCGVGLVLRRRQVEAWRPCRLCRRGR